MVYYRREVSVRKMRVSARRVSSSRLLRPAGTRRHYGEWAGEDNAAGPATVSGRAGSTVFSEYADEYDVHRPTYPAEMWDVVDAACAQATQRTQPDLRVYSDAETYRPVTEESPRTWPNDSDGAAAVAAPFGTALDIAAGTGRGALELARRGRFQEVIATDLDHGMLAQAQASARARELHVGTLHAPAEELTGVHDGTVDLCVSLQAFHWFDAENALREFRRVLDPERGVLLLAWNDRDTTVPWIQEMEALLEECNPLYNRRLKQTEHVTSDGKIFWPMFVPVEEGSGEDAKDLEEWGGSAREVSCLQFTNPTRGMTSDGLVAQMRTMSYVRNALDDTQLTSFESRLRKIVADYHGDAPFDMPWTTKAYLLKPHWESPFPPDIL